MCNLRSDVQRSILWRQLAGKRVVLPTISGTVVQVGTKYLKVRLDDNYYVTIPVAHSYVLEVQDGDYSPH